LHAASRRYVPRHHFPNYLNPTRVLVIECAKSGGGTWLDREAVRRGHLDVNDSSRANGLSGVCHSSSARRIHQTGNPSGGSFITSIRIRGSNR
jgi:hypothetical protein